MLHTSLFNVAQPAFNDTQYASVIIGLHANIGPDRRQSIIGVHGVRKPPACGLVVFDYTFSTMNHH